jgi:hypothetical protein
VKLFALNINCLHLLFSFIKFFQNSSDLCKAGALLLWHPARDASLTGCKTGLYGFSTERYIPNGMLFAIDDFAVKNNKKAVKQCSL